MKHADPMEGQSNSPSASLHTRKRMVHRVETGRRVVRRRYVCQALSLPSFRLSQHLDKSHPHLATYVGVERTFHPWGSINLIIRAPSFCAVKLRYSYCAHPRVPHWMHHSRCITSPAHFLTHSQPSPPRTCFAQEHGLEMGRGKGKAGASRGPRTDHPPYETTGRQKVSSGWMLFWRIADWDLARMDWV